MVQCIHMKITNNKIMSKDSKNFNVFQAAYLIAKIIKSINKQGSKELLDEAHALVIVTHRQSCLRLDYIHEIYHFKKYIIVSWSSLTMIPLILSPSSWQHMQEISNTKLWTINESSHQSFLRGNWFVNNFIAVSIKQSTSATSGFPRMLALFWA